MKTFWLWTIIPFSLFVKSPDFELLSASAKKWTGGMQGTGGGLNYRIEIVVNHSSEKLVFTELLVPDECLEVKIIRRDLVCKDVNFNKGDTIVITASKRILPDYKNDNNVDKSEIKIAEGAGLLLYKKKKKERSFVIDDFEKPKSSNNLRRK